MKAPADSPVARCDAESRLHQGANPEGRGRMFFEGFGHLMKVALLEMVMTSLCQRPSRDHPSSRTGCPEAVQSRKPVPLKVERSAIVSKGTPLKRGQCPSTIAGYSQAHGELLP